MGVTAVRIQQLDLKEMLVEFPCDVDMNQICQDILNLDQWSGISCNLLCSVLDSDQLRQWRAKPRAPLMCDLESVSPDCKHILPPAGCICRSLHCEDEIVYLWGTNSTIVNTNPAITVSGNSNVPSAQAWQLKTEYRGQYVPQGTNPCASIQPFPWGLTPKQEWSFIWPVGVWSRVYKYTMGNWF